MGETSNVSVVVSEGVSKFEPPSFALRHSSCKIVFTGAIKIYNRIPNVRHWFITFWHLLSILKYTMRQLNS